MSSAPVAHERAVDALYEESPASFTEKRDALVRELKSKGEAGAASDLKQLRKPTRIAFILNQLARRHPDAVTDLVDVGRDLARAQRSALRGSTSDGLRDVIARQRKVVAEVTRVAGELMRELEVGVNGLDEVASALRAALVDPTAGAALEAGRLEKAPEASAGFPGLELAMASAEAPAPPKKAKGRAADGREKAKAAQKAELARAKREAEAVKQRELRRKADAADEDAQAREDEAAAAARIAKDRHEKVEALAAQLAEARREAKRAATTARKLGAIAATARRTAKKLAA